MTRNYVKTLLQEQNPPNGKIKQPEQNPQKCNVSTNRLNNRLGVYKFSQETQGEGEQFAKINMQNL